MTRKTHKRRQRGGFWNPFASSSDSTTANDSDQGFFGSIMSKTKDLGSKANSQIGDMASGFTSKVGDFTQSSWDSAKNIASSDVPLTTTTSSDNSEPSSTGGQIVLGGKRRKRRVRGGQVIPVVVGGQLVNLAGGQLVNIGGGNQDLQFASPVSGLKVAEPTTMQYYANGTDQYSTKGGRRRRRRTRRTRRRTRSKRTKRRHH
jgi:hypothetical protein